VDELVALYTELTQGPQSTEAIQRFAANRLLHSALHNLLSLKRNLSMVWLKLTSIKYLPTAKDTLGGTGGMYLIYPVHDEFSQPIPHHFTFSNTLNCGVSPTKS